MQVTLLDPAQDFNRIKDIWCTLSQSASPSFFLSWGWTENWIACLPENNSVRLAVFSENDRPILAFFLGEAKTVRHGIFRSRSFFLHATGIPSIDRLAIEYNAMLHANNFDHSLQEVLELLPNRWDEFSMPGLDVGAFPGNQLDSARVLGALIVERDVPSPYVDLDLVRSKNGDYVSLLSASTRSLIRRSYRGYEARGQIVLEVAPDKATALMFFAEMVHLHQKTWQARGETGAFATEFFRHFHQELIQKRFDCGDIQLLRVTADHTTIGCLYNFVFNRKVYFYQSGVNYEEDSRLKPGFMCHVEAIKYNAEIGNMYYDFLGGDAPYKDKLSTHQQRLVWVTLQKPRLQFQIESELRSAKRLVRSFQNLALNRPA